MTYRGRCSWQPVFYKKYMKEPPCDLCNLPPTLKVSSEMGVASVFGAELTIRKCVRGKAVKMFPRAAPRGAVTAGRSLCTHSHASSLR